MLVHPQTNRELSDVNKHEHSIERTCTICGARFFAKEGTACPTGDGGLMTDSHE